MRSFSKLGAPPLGRLVCRAHRHAALWPPCVGCIRLGSPLAEDLVFQYVDFFACPQKLDRESVFPPTACGLGANTWGLYSYYLASPFNLLLPFFDEAHLTLFVFVADAL